MSARAARQYPRTRRAPPAVESGWFRSRPTSRVRGAQRARWRCAARSVYGNALMSSSELGFAIVGTGMIAGYHAQAIRQTEGARLVGVVSRSPEKGAAFATRHEIPILTSSVEEMVQRPDVHVV